MERHLPYVDKLRNGRGSAVLSTGPDRVANDSIKWLLLGWVCG